MIKTLFIYFCIHQMLFSSVSYTWEFPEKDPHLPDFTRLCERIKETVDVVDAPSCFISYVWHDVDHPANQWSHKVNEYLLLAGVRTTCDINPNRGLTQNIHRYINSIPDHPSAVILLSPMTPISIERKPFFKEELRKIKESNVTTHYVLLWGSLRNAVPEHLKPLREQLLHIMTREDITTLSDDDPPTIERFYLIMCNLLDPHR